METAYDNDNVFARIIRGEAPCFKVCEDEDAIAFMDIMPQINGHVLVVPREPAVTLFELSDRALLASMRMVQRVGLAAQKAMKAKGVCTFQQNGSAVGQTILHAHFHVIPGSLQDLRGHAAEVASPGDLQEYADRIIACLD